LKSERVGEERRDKIGFPLEKELKLAAASQIPPSQYLDSMAGRIENHEADQNRGEVKCQDGWMKNH
jgi:hypothetical protein